METRFQYVIPAILSVLLHLGIVGALVVTVEFSSKEPITPLAIQAMLVTDSVPPRPVVEPDPVEEDPIEEPVVEERLEPPPPDPAEEQRIQAEEQARLEEAAREQARIEQQEREAEQKRLAEEAERKRQAEEDARRKREEEERLRREREERLERERAEAEARRKAEEERQRQENLRRRREAEEAMRQQEMDNETRRLEAMAANEMQAYEFAIRQKIQRNWVRPPTAQAGLECVVNVRQSRAGDVLSVSIGACNGDQAVRDSIERAVYNASPLPEPSNPSIFERDLRITFKPEQ